MDPKSVVSHTYGLLGRKILNVGKDELEALLKSPSETNRLAAQALSNLKALQENELAVESSSGRLHSELTDTQKRLILSLPSYHVDLCTTEQPTTIKASFPFNPTIESNVFRSDENIHPDQSLGFGGTVQVTTGGWRPYDMMGFSVGSTSLRYQTFAQKDVDSLPVQAAYQFFLGASGYSVSGHPIDIGEPSTSTDLKYIPPSGLVTIDTLAIGFQSQTSFSTPFKQETAELFTPQLTLGRQNISLSGNDPHNVCHIKGNDPTKDAYCYYADLSLTLGQTVSDQVALQNFSAAAVASLGRRIENSNWNFVLQTTLTERAYEDVAGGRNDFQVQVGPTLSYAGTIAALNNAPFTFSLPVTYTENISTIEKDTWQGVVVVPTLTLAFQSELKAN